MNENMHLDDWYTKPGVYATYDGQFGSTGKGLLAAWLAMRFAKRIHLYISNMGPNSGHYAYVDGAKVRSRLIPMGAHVAGRGGRPYPSVFLSAGAILDPEVLRSEIGGSPPMSVNVHRNAAVVDPDMRGDTSVNASTGQGVGEALMRKIHRKKLGAVWGHRPDVHEPRASVVGRCPAFQVAQMEVGQGWGLGINTGPYPYATSRECTPAQGMVDAGLPPRMLRRTIVSLRLRPIRTGNSEDGTSGPPWSGSREIAWSEIGQEPEVASVTGRHRRLFSWSGLMYREMLLATQPDALFFNFCNYHPDTWEEEVRGHVEVYRRILGWRPDFVLCGHGPDVNDVQIWGR